MNVIGAQFEKNELCLALAEEPEKAGMYVAGLISTAIGHPLTYRPNEGLAVLDRKAMKQFHLIPGFNIAIGNQPETSRTLWRMDRETWERLESRGVASLRQNFIVADECYSPWDSHQTLENEGTVGGLYWAGREYSIECSGPLPCEEAKERIATLITVRPEGIGSSFALDRVARSLSAKS